MKKFKIVVLPGDGIGPEIIHEGLKVLKSVEENLNNINFEFIEYECGAQYYLKTGKKEEWPKEVFDEKLFLIHQDAWSD